MKNYKVYLIRDKTKNIVYVGLTGQTLKKRFEQHLIKRSWNINDFCIELVQEYLTLDEAVILEEILIKQYNTRINGFNVSPRSINGYSNAHSEEQKKQWSIERKGKSVSEEHAAKNRVARLGKKNSPEHLQKILEGKQKPVICIETGKTYPSARAAGKELNVSYSKISNCCNGKRNSTKGLHFKFLERNDRDKQK